MYEMNILIKYFSDKYTVQNVLYLFSQFLYVFAFLQHDTTTLLGTRNFSFSHHVSNITRKPY